MKRRSDEKINDFVNRFEEAANVAKRSKMELPTKVKGLKLLNDAGFKDVEMKLVLTEVNFNNKEEVYKAAKMGLAKYINSEGTAHTVLKVEPVMTAQMEEALLANGWAKPNGRGGNRGGGSYGWPSPHLNFGPKTSPYRNTTKTQSTRQQPASQPDSSKTMKPENPKNAKGEVIQCPSCMRFRHLLANCVRKTRQLQEVPVWRRKSANIKEGSINICFEIFSYIYLASG